MRDYAKISPTFWTGKTGRALKRRGIEGVVVALYLVSSPHSNMLGLFYQPALYLAEETGLPIEGAWKGLRDCIACGFCSYDEGTKTVWVHEMAAWQIADSLASTDKRCKGIQKDYDALPDNPFLGPFFDRYAASFNLSNRREFEGEIEPEQEAPYQAPSKPLRSQEQEQEQEQEYSEAKASAAAAAPASPEPMTDKDRLWALGVAILGEKGRSFLGKAVSTWGESTVLACLVACNAEKPGEPKAWLTQAFEARGKAPKSAARTNGNHSATTEDLLSRDPHPQWALQAGFSDLWQAESAGCGPGNATQFRNGRRITQ